MTIQVNNKFNIGDRVKTTYRNGAEREGFVKSILISTEGDSVSDDELKYCIRYLAGGLTGGISWSNSKEMSAI